MEKMQSECLQNCSNSIRVFGSSIVTIRWWVHNCPSTIRPAVLCHLKYTVKCSLAQLTKVIGCHVMTCNCITFTIPVQEKSTNCGTKAADAPHNFKVANIVRIQWIFWCIRVFATTIDFTTPINSKCSSIWKRLALIWRGEFWDPQFGGLAGWDSHQPKTYPQLPNTSQYKLLCYMPPFGCNLKREFWGPPIWGVWEVTGELAGW